MSYRCRKIIREWLWLWIWVLIINNIFMEENDFNKIIRPRFEILKKSAEFREFLEKELEELEKLLNKNNLDDICIEKEIEPIIDRIDKIIENINLSDHKNSDDINTKAFKILESNPYIKKMEDKFIYLKNKLEHIKNRRGMNEDNLWWKKQEKKEEQEAELWEKYNKNKDTK